VATCRNCGCEFTFEREDVIFGNQRELENFVMCPCCKKLIQIYAVPMKWEWAEKLTFLFVNNNKLQLINAYKAQNKA
jgi:hypothetical protein